MNKHEGRHLVRFAFCKRLDVLDEAVAPPEDARLSRRTQARQRRSGRKRNRSRTGGDLAGSMSANRMVSPCEPVASNSPSGSTMRLSPTYCSPPPSPTRLQPDDVGLVLDRPGLQQRHPVVRRGLGPVGRHEVQVGGGGEPPELVGEAQVVADERADAHALDLDLHQAVAGAEVGVLAAEGERVDLVVAVHRAVGAGEHEAVRRPAVGGVAVGGDLGAAAAHPHPVLRGLLHAGTVADGPPSGSPRCGLSTAKPVENVSVSSTSRAPRRRPRRRPSEPGDGSSPRGRSR